MSKARSRRAVALKKKSEDENDKKTIKRDKTCAAVKFNKILEAFNENVKMKCLKINDGKFKHYRLGRNTI